MGVAPGGREREGKGRERERNRSAQVVDRKATARKDTHQTGLSLGANVVVQSKANHHL